MPRRWRPQKAPPPPDDQAGERAEHQGVLADAFTAMVLAAHSETDAHRVGGAAWGAGSAALATAPRTGVRRFLARRAGHHGSELARQLGLRVAGGAISDESLDFHARGLVDDAVASGWTPSGVARALRERGVALPGEALHGPAKAERWATLSPWLRERARRDASFRDHLLAFVERGHDLAAALQGVRRFLADRRDVGAVPWPDDPAARMAALGRIASLPSLPHERGPTPGVRNAERTAERAADKRAFEAQRREAASAFDALVKKTR